MIFTTNLLDASIHLSVKYTENLLNNFHLRDSTKAMLPIAQLKRAIAESGCGV